MRTTEESQKFYVVTIEKDDVAKAIIEAARLELAHGFSRSADPAFAPQVISDGFGGFKIYFLALNPARAEAKKAVAA